MCLHETTLIDSIMNFRFQLNIIINMISFIPMLFINFRLTFFEDVLQKVVVHIKKEFGDCDDFQIYMVHKVLGNFHIVTVLIPFVHFFLQKGNKMIVHKISLLSEKGERKD